MFIVVYLFKIKPDLSNEFLKAWSELTSLIYKYENSLGSRIHMRDKENYVAYAQWPNSETFQNSGTNLPKESTEIRNRMRNTCYEIKVIDKMEVIEDKLSNKTYN